MTDREEYIPIVHDQSPEQITDPDESLNTSTVNPEMAAIQQLQEQVAGLQDLFVRRLMEDRQKAELIRTLQEGVNYAFIVPFLSDLILLLDRLENAEDDFSQSIKDELLDIIESRGVKRIEVTSNFNPAFNKAVKVIEDENVKTLCVVRTIRNGYAFSGKVIRAAEVEVLKPTMKQKT